MKTSKLFLFIWLLLGIALLIFSELSTNHLILYLAGLAILLWNRLDSRGRAYKFQVHGPGGSRLTLSADNENAFEETDSKSSKLEALEGGCGLPSSRGPDA
jgi:hypothetical protein